MSYRALLLDLDGTTIVSNQRAHATHAVREAVIKAQERISVCIASGRSLAEAEYLLDELNISSPSILNHGAEIYDPRTKKTLWSATLSEDQARAIYGIYKRNNLPAYLFNDPKHREYHGEAVNAPIYGLWSVGVAEQKAADLEKQFLSLGYVAVNKTPSWDKGGLSLEITRSDATKAHAACELIKFLHVRREEVIGVGDSYNDYPLLMACGLKIAMGNALPELKAIADYIAPSVTEDGVATVIEKFVLTS